MMVHVHDFNYYKVNDDMIYILTDKSGYVIPKITLHFIDKYFLFDEKFDIFCDRILNE